MFSALAARAQAAASRLTCRQALLGHLAGHVAVQLPPLQREGGQALRQAARPGRLWQAQGRQARAAHAFGGAVPAAGAPLPGPQACSPAAGEPALGRVLYSAGAVPRTCVAQDAQDQQDAQPRGPYQARAARPAPGPPARCRAGWPVGGPGSPTAGRAGSCWPWRWATASRRGWPGSPPWRACPGWAAWPTAATASQPAAAGALWRHRPDSQGQLGRLLSCC